MVSSDVPQEVVAVALAFEIRLGLDVPDVVVERELHVHVHDEVVREEEREVGDAVAAHGGALLPVVHVLDEVGEAQDVLGHALAPPAAGLRAREHLAEALGRVQQVRESLALLRQLLAELAELPVAVGLEDAHEVAHFVEPPGHRLELLVDQ